MKVAGKLGQVTIPQATFEDGILGKRTHRAWHWHGSFLV
jgi:hypothetical protein